MNVGARRPLWREKGQSRGDPEGSHSQQEQRQVGKVGRLSLGVSQEERGGQLGLRRPGEVADRGWPGRSGART